MLNILTVKKTPLSIEAILSNFTSITADLDKIISVNSTRLSDIRVEQDGLVAEQEVLRQDIDRAMAVKTNLTALIEG